MKEEKIFGYNESKVRETFYQEEMKPVNAKKVDPEKRTLETLKDSSKKLLEENPELLREIYGD